MPKPSWRVKMAIVIAASSERPNESSNAERCVALMNRPPVLQRMAAPRTSRRGEDVLGLKRAVFHLSFDMFHFSFCLSEQPHSPRCLRRDSPMTNEKCQCQMSNTKKLNSQHR